VLHFLEKSQPNQDNQTPLDVLLARRPDLEHLKLTCENTETPLPYIDLVNEVLESYIALGSPLVNNTSQSATAAELSVNREYRKAGEIDANDPQTPFTESISTQAYGELQAAVYPLCL